MAGTSAAAAWAAVDPHAARDYIEAIVGESRYGEAMLGALVRGWVQADLAVAKAYPAFLMRNTGYVECMAGPRPPPRFLK